MLRLRLLFVAAVLVRTGVPANLAISTYLRDGFTPSAMASDSQGNIYIAGSTVIDAASQSTGAMVAKVDPKVTQYLYLAYLDSAANDHITAIVVDSAGNVYVAGYTGNPSFPVVGGGTLGTPPAAQNDTRSFVTKLDPQGAVVFSVLIGGATNSSAQGIAITPKGQILVSGIASSSGFPTTSGAYTVADSNGEWFLMELDATASRMVFSATGFGGSSFAFDAAGNIYMAGNSGLDYPTTTGAYQTTFAQGYVCYNLCQIGFPGNLQHVTKVDPTASALLYSTGLNDMSGGAGSTTNTGLAVDASGNAYVTGTVFEGIYPLTVSVDIGYQTYLGYLSKLDPTGAKLLFSVPAGGSGLQIDASGALYAGGFITSTTYVGFVRSFTPVAPPPIFSWIPQLCLPDNITANNAAYVMKVDPASGNVQDAQWIDGSSPGATAIVLGAGKVWITGTTLTNDVPYSPGVFAADNIAPGYLSGAYLSAVDFSGGASTGPAIACVLDSGNMTHVGPVASYQLISIYGANLGPAAGVAAPDGTDTSIAGVSVTFNGNAAQLLYVSSSQINVVVPEPPRPANGELLPTSVVMQLTVNSTSIERQFPFTASNPNVFADLSASTMGNGFQPVALNPDSTLNSSANPAPFGSTLSFFIHGVGAQSLGFPPPASLSGLQANIGTCPAVAANANLIDGYVYKVDVPMSSKTSLCATGVTAAGISVTFTYNGTPVGPRALPSGPVATFTPGVPMPLTVWLK